MNFMEYALKYHKAGLKVIPFWNRKDGGKAFPDPYAQYRQDQTESDIQKLFSGSCDGIALLCTDGIEAIDIDVKHDPKRMIAKEWFDAAMYFQSSKEALELCTIQKTKNGGYHVIYRTEKPDGNEKLAKRFGQKEHCLETRGNGGILFVHPTPGYIVKVGELTDIQSISKPGRDRFFEIAKYFHCPDPIPVPQKVKTSVPIQSDGRTPWEDFNDSTDVLEMMEGYGWSVISRTPDYVRLNRPGAKHSRGVDATVIVPANLFYPFSTSTQFQTEKGYTPFAVYTVMEFGSDSRDAFSEAAKDLYRKGYGDRVIMEVPKESNKGNIIAKELISQVISTRFDYHAEIKEEDAILTHFLEDQQSKIGGLGQMGVFTGHEKSGKSYVLSCIAASAMAGGFEKCAFQLDLQGKKMAWFDTEQSKYFYQLTQRRIHWLANKRQNVAHYSAYHLRRLSVDERLKSIEHLIYDDNDLACVVVDGYVDLIHDYNSLEEAQRLASLFLKWTDERNILLLGVLHVNKGDGKIRGHLGSELKNKCDFIINVKQSEPGFYEISNPTARYKGFKSFTFTRDEQDLPIVDGYVKSF